jgi:phosphoserine phosphatase RsbU/P
MSEPEGGLVSATIEVRSETEVRSKPEARSEPEVRARREADARHEASVASKLDAHGDAHAHSSARTQWLLTLLLAVVIGAVAVVISRTGPALIPAAWLAAGPLLGSLVLSPRITALLAGWAVLLAIGLVVTQPASPGLLASHLSVCALLAGFAVVNSALRTAAQRRISQVRAVARVAQAAILRDVPATVTAGRLASRYVSASPEARVGGDLLEVVAGPGNPRWLI